MENCTFCKIIDRKIPGFIIDEDDDLIVFLSLENHPLIVPKKHLPDIFALEDEMASLVMKKAVRIAKATKTALESDGIYLAQANGEAAGQDVFHYHLHVYPRWSDKNALGVDAESRQRVMEQIKEQLR
ncbi:MAG: HIT domain-containing protein [bacterium]|nr:HIT domain-containing protein [bacterium]MDZ4296475.1 HIT domain-containing protein [Patescibacteria group bacterium]